MRRLALVLVAFGCAAAAEPRRIVNTFELTPAEGTAEIEWVSQSTFRFARSWGARTGVRKPVGIKPVVVEVNGSTFETRYLRVVADESGDVVKIATAGGLPVTELRVRRDEGRAVVEQPARNPERFFGLGARGAAKLDVRGTTVVTRDPFLISGAGYGEFYTVPGEYTFDVAASEPRTVRVAAPGDSVELFFYYGPRMKEIFEEHMGATGAVPEFGALDFAIRESKGPAGAGSWSTLGEALRALLNGSLSAKLLPSFDLAPFARSDGAVFERAAEVASLMPVLYAPSQGAVERRRKMLEPYLLSYTREARDRGFPVIRPLVVDYAQDAAASGRTDEFLLGDELLVAPVLGPVSEINVYFPKGVWTDLSTGAAYKGRESASVRTAPGVLPIFARNGTIVPLRAEDGDVLELHYFPSLGAEFFLDEESDPEVSQFHAAPAGDLIRLETESKADRVYEWVIHHSAGCRSVESDGAEFRRVEDRSQLAPGSWHFDATGKVLGVRVRSVAGGDEIVNVRMSGAD